MQRTGRGGRQSSPSDVAATRSVRQSRQRTKPPTRFFRGKTRATTATGHAPHRCTCGFHLASSDTRADVDPEPPHAALLALAAQATRLWRARLEPCCAGTGRRPAQHAAPRPDHCHARANAARGAGRLTVTETSSPGRHPSFGFFSVSRASNRRLRQLPEVTVGDVRPPRMAARRRAHETHADQRDSA